MGRITQVIASVAFAAEIRNTLHLSFIRLQVVVSEYRYEKQSFHFVFWQKKTAVDISKKDKYRRSNRFSILW